jgi:hypothetical protein
MKIIYSRKRFHRVVSHKVIGVKEDGRDMVLYTLDCGHTIFKPRKRNGNFNYMAPCGLCRSYYENEDAKAR